MKCANVVVMVEYVMNKSIAKFHLISNSIEISSVGRAPVLFAYVQSIASLTPRAYPSVWLTQEELHTAFGIKDYNGFRSADNGPHSLARVARAVSHSESFSIKHSYQCWDL